GTIQFWFNARSTQGDQTIFAKNGGDDDANALTIGLDGNHLVAQIGDDGDDISDGGSIRSSATVAAGSWHQVTLTFGAGGMQLYLDGNLVGTDAYRGGLVGNTDDITLGGDPTQGPHGWFGWCNRSTGVGDAFDGFVDEVAIFGQALAQG